MFLFYVDETGNRDPRLVIRKHNGQLIQGDPLYVLTAVCLFEHRWRGFERTLNNQKITIAKRIQTDHGLTLDLADCEIKSNWLRQPRARAARPFLSHMTEDERTGLVDTFYHQLNHHNMHIFSIIVDKRQLLSDWDQDRIHRKSWQRLLYVIERFMRGMNPKHKAILVNDDVSVQVNRMLAMEHARLVERGTQDGLWLNHICEMPMFVRSELSNGVQLADLCSYNIYRALKQEDMEYEFFKKISPRIWSPSLPMKHGARQFPGLFIIPSNSGVKALVDQFEKERSSVS